MPQEHNYPDLVFDDYIISPLDGTKKKGLTLKYLEKFSYKSFEEFRKDFPDFPRMCNNSRKNQNAKEHGSEYCTSVLKSNEENIIRILKSAKNVIK